MAGNDVCDSFSGVRILVTPLGARIPHFYNDTFFGKGITENENCKSAVLERSKKEKAGYAKQKVGDSRSHKSASHAGPFSNPAFYK